MNKTPLLGGLLGELCGEPGISDLTLCSDGRLALRHLGRIVVSRNEILISRWTDLCSGLGTPVEARSRVVLDPAGRRYRVTYTGASHGESLAVRPLSGEIPSCDELLLPSFLGDYLASLVSGLVLIVGPTGSGKSTTMAMLLRDRGLRRGGKYVTLEDPVELLFPAAQGALYEQREIGVHTPTYAKGLKDSLHMNPDVISVQELREPEAAETALGASLSGHLVLASMHGLSASVAPQRYLSLLDPSLSDLGARDALASSLQAVIFQRLLPGFTRMVPVLEVMLFNDSQGRLRSMEHLVRTGNWAGLRQEMEVGTRSGMQLFEDHLEQRIREGFLPRDRQNS